MKKILKRIGLVLIALIIVSYFIPAKKQGFFKLYNNDDNASKTLKEFQSRPTKSIVVDGVNWIYSVSGKGEKTILFMHGMGGSYDLWWQQIIPLEKKHKIISYTLPEEISTLAETTKGITAILDIEKTTKFYGVGTSMGGYIAQYLVQKMPNRVEKIVFSNTFPVNDVLQTKNKMKSKIIPLLPEILIASLAEKQLKEKLIPAGKNDKLLAAFLPSLPFSKKQFLNRYNVVIDPFVIKNDYAQKRIPKLIIESDNDPLVEKVLRENMKNVYTKSKVFTFHNEGHFPYINAATTYNKVLIDFFNEENEFETVEKTIKNYFNGRREANITQLANAFSKTATLFTVKKGKKLAIPLANYLTKVKRDGAKNVKTTILGGSITGDIANFQTYFEYPSKSYTDYLSLLKINNQWKINSKTFVKKRSEI